MQGPVLHRRRPAAERRAGVRSSTRSSRSASGRTAMRSASTSGTIRTRKMTIVGVVGTVKQYGLDVDGRIVVYRPVAERRLSRRADVRRSRRRWRGAMVRKIHELDPTITVFDVQTMTERMSGLDGAAALFDADARRVRGVRADAGGRRRLRRDVAPGGAGRARHRRAHGARRRAEPHPADGAAPGPGADGRRHRRRARSARRR